MNEGVAAAAEWQRKSATWFALLSVRGVKDEWSPPVLYNNATALTERQEIRDRLRDGWVSRPWQIHVKQSYLTRALQEDPALRLKPVDFKVVPG